MAEFRLSPRAQRDLDGIFDQTVVRWGLTQAFRYTDLIESACTRLAGNPELARNCSHIRPEYKRSRAGHHVIYFKPTIYGIAIVRILHERMDPTRHL